MTDITELAPAMKAAAELITSGYSRKWIVSHDDETCWVGANDDDGNLTPFIEVSIADWSGNKADNEALARFIALCRPAVVLALVEALEGRNALVALQKIEIRELNAELEKAQRANAAQDDHINQQQDRIESLEKKNAELGKYAGGLESFRTAYMEWGDKTDWVRTDRRFDVVKPLGKHLADVLRAYIEHLESRTVAVKQGEVLVTVVGFTGCGKSAIAGEIEIAMKAIGVPVTWANGDSEKRMTGADWLTAIEMYKPTVRIVEVNIPRPAGIKVEAE